MLDGDTVSVPLAEARALCPDETVAMEKAGERVTEALGRGDKPAAEEATEELRKCMEALLHALAEALR